MTSVSWRPPDAKTGTPGPSCVVSRGSSARAARNPSYSEVSKNSSISRRKTGITSLVEPFTTSTKDDKLRFYAKGKEVLTLAKEEIEELRNNEKELSEYPREKILAIGRECMLRYDEALRKLAE